MSSRLLLAVAVLLFLPARSPAYPPAPDHLIYGQVRDEYGNPLTLSSAEVYLETSAGTRIQTRIIPGLEPGVNYKLPVPMDSGLTADQYLPTALQPAVPFKMWVRINGVTYLPMEMSLNSAQLGRPGERTKLDLTLGEDRDGDGLPDAWERAMLAALGLNMNIADFKPGDDSDHDGLSNSVEYIAGTYASDPKDGFTLKVASYANGVPVLEFLGIRGRTYSVLGSENLTDWTPVGFRTPGGTEAPSMDYYATDVRTMRIEVPRTETKAPAFKFYKLMVR